MNAFWERINTISINTDAENNAIRAFIDCKRPKAAPCGQSANAPPGSLTEHDHD